MTAPYAARAHSVQAPNQTGAIAIAHKVNPNEPVLVERVRTTSNDKRRKP